MFHICAQVLGCSPSGLPGGVQPSASTALPTAAAPGSQSASTGPMHATPVPELQPGMFRWHIQDDIEDDTHAAPISEDEPAPTPEEVSLCLRQWYTYN